METVEFRHHPISADVLWDGMLGGTVRIRALVEGQSDETARRIRAAFDRLIAGCDTGDGIEIPVSVKIASACKPG